MKIWYYPYKARLGGKTITGTYAIKTTKTVEPTRTRRRIAARKAAEVIRKSTHGNIASVILKSPNSNYDYLHALRYKAGLYKAAAA